MKIKNLEVGLRVQVKSKSHSGFYASSAGKFGTIVDIDMPSHLDVQVQYDDGGTEWGNHEGIKRVKTTLQDLKVGDRVEIKHKRSTSFYVSNMGRIGTVVYLDPDVHLDVKVKFDDGETDWGSHKDISTVPEPKTTGAIEVGSRVRIVRNLMYGFLAGDVGTVKAIDDGVEAAIHFDVARNGWKHQDYGIPDRHGLWVELENLEVITD